MSLVLQEINKQYIATNNGLEQVYQNKLVEGRDFEKYDWLKCDGEAYIETNILPNWGDSLRGRMMFNESIIKLRKNAILISARESAETDSRRITLSTGGAFFNNNELQFIVCYSLTGNGPWIVLNNNAIAIPSEFQGDIDFGYTLTQKSSEDIFVNFIMNGKEIKLYTNKSSTYKTGNLILSSYVIGRGRFGISAPCNINYAKINNHIFSPIKLLSPCPPNLSANGKPYAQGECGMIDAISGKFFGNSGSGSFSVYNDPTE